MTEAVAEVKPTEQNPKQGRTVITGATMAKFALEKINANRPEEERIVAQDSPTEKPAIEVKTGENTEKNEHPTEPKTGEKPDLTAEQIEQRKQQGKDYATKLAQARERAERAEKEAAELRAKINPPKPDESRPNREQFANDKEYELALEDYLSEKVTREAEAKKVVAAFEERKAAFSAETPDFDEVLESAKGLNTYQDVINAMIESEVGPQLFYHIMKNPEIVEQINAMPLRKALYFVGSLETKIERKIARQEKTAETAAKPVKAISKAPAPIEPLKGSGESPVPRIGADGEYKGTYQQWKADRKAGRIH